MNFSIQPEFFYSRRDRIRIMIKYKVNQTDTETTFSRWFPLNLIIYFNEFYDTVKEYPNIYNIINIAVQLKHEEYYYVYNFFNPNKEPLNLNQENVITIISGYHPNISINNILVPNGLCCIYKCTCIRR